MTIVPLHVPESAVHTHSAGQSSESACLQCSSSQSCPEGTSIPTSIVQGVTAMQIVTYVFSVVCSIVGILVGFFRVYPFFKSRIAKLREAGIKPTFKRVIFLHKALSKYRPLLEPGDRSLQVGVPENKLALGARVHVAGLTLRPQLNGCTAVICGDCDAATGRWPVRLDLDNSLTQLLPQNMKLHLVAARGVSEAVASASASLATANAPPALLRLNAIQIGHLVHITSPRFTILALI